MNAVSPVGRYWMGADDVPGAAGAILTRETVTAHPAGTPVNRPADDDERYVRAVAGDEVERSAARG